MQKNKQIPIEEAENIIRREVKKQGYQLITIKSESTISRYYKISSGQYDLSFRISDHATQKRLMTLRIDHKTSVKNIEQFAKNRCKDLGKRIIKQALGVL